jgi:ubiquinone biosynthesis protein UbiJ
LFSEPLFKPVENLINRGIEQSAEAAKLCAELDGRMMSVIVSMQPLRIPLKLRTTAIDGKICISGRGDNEVDVELTATLIELSRMMFSDSQLPLRDGGVRIHGDTEIAEQFRRLFLLSRPNLEEELGDLVGDEAASQIARAFTRFRSFAVDTLDDFADDISIYLKEDGSPLPERSETETFFRNVDELSNDLARIDARVSRIKEKLEKHDHGED